MSQDKNEKQSWREKARRFPVVRWFTANTWLKVLSIVFAVIIWSVVISQTNPQRKKNVFDVPIERAGVVTMESRGLALVAIPEELSGTVDVVVEAAMDDLARVDNTTVKARVDFSNITAVGEYTLPIQFSLINGISATVDSRNVSEVTVEIESLVKVNVPVKVNYSGSLGEEYKRSKEVISPSQVAISGPATVINSVSEARIDVNLTGLSDSYSKALPFTLVDSNGEPVDASALTIEGGETVSVTVPIYPVKEVPIVFEESMLGEVAQGYELIDAHTIPKTIKIAAERSALASIESISAAAFDISDLNENTILTLALSKPADVIWMEYDEVSLSLEIREERVNKTFTYLPVEVINLSELFHASTYDAVVDIQITMPKSLEKQITRDKIQAVVDLSNAIEGSLQQDVTILIDVEEEIKNQLEINVLPGTIVVMVYAPT